MKNHTVQLDDDVFQWLQGLAEPLVDSTSDVLRKIKRKLNDDEVPDLINNLRSQRSRVRTGKKQLKANLVLLTKIGLTHEGQHVFMHDYSGNKLDHSDVLIEGNRLRFEDQSYSMTALARRFLKENGYESDNVPGPIFWYTEKGDSIRELWKLYLKQNS